MESGGNLLCGIASRRFALRHALEENPIVVRQRYLRQAAPGILLQSALTRDRTRSTPKPCYPESCSVVYKVLTSLDAPDRILVGAKRLNTDAEEGVVSWRRPHSLGGGASC